MSSEIIWANGRKKPIPLDNAATELLLQLYGSEKYQALFNDKKSVKKHIWQGIAKKILDEGFNFGTDDVGVMGSKCDQKWRNLEKNYQEYIKRSFFTGKRGGIRQPAFYEEVHSIVGTRHANVPVRILDSAAPTEEEASTSTSSSTVGRRPLKDI